MTSTATYYNGTCMTSEQFCGIFDYTYVKVVHAATYNLCLTIFQDELCSNSKKEFKFSDLGQRVSPAEDFYNRYDLALKFGS